VSAVAILAPGYPNDRGGVTDHTARLVRHWSRDGREVVVLGARQGEPREVVASWRARGVAAALVQYVPFLYGRRGLSRFPGALARAAREAGIRLSIFVHEPWVPPTRLPWLVLSPLQRRQLLALLRLATAAATPVPAWVPRLRVNPTVIHVGSTLGEPAEGPAGPLLPAPVLFSPFAAGLSWRWIVAAVRAIRADPPLIVIGGDADAMRRHHAARRWFDPRWECRGFLSPAEVLAMLARARLVLAPFLDGLTGRRTSALAALSAGARLVSSRGHLYDPFFDQSPATLAHTEREFASAANDVWAEDDSIAQRQERLRWYRQQLDPQELDERLLQLVTGAPAG
jgi:hypothetical protein